MSADLAPSAEQSFLLLTAGFAAALLLQHLFSWAARMGARVHLWGWVWASGALAWCIARSFEIATFPAEPDQATRWRAVSVVAHLPVAVGLLGVLGSARHPVLPRQFGAAAVALVLGGAVGLLGLAAVVPPSLVVRQGASGASFLLADPGPALLWISLLALAAVLASLVLLLRRQPLDAYLRVLALVGGLAWVLALANDLLMGAGLVHTAPLTPHGLLVLGLALAAVVGSDSGLRREELAQALHVHRRRSDEQNHLLARALADAREAGEARQRFLARMSHELRTPLNGVLGMTGLALDGDLDEAQRRYLEQARSSAEQLLSLVDDLLDLSRLDEGRLSLAEESFPLRPCLVDSLRIVGAQAAEQGLELVLDAPEDLPDQLVGDPVRLRQVLVNLLGNAVKFTEQGQVVLRARPLSEHNGRLVVRFEVQDTGPGIPADELPRIVQPFVQGAAGEGRGTGLGLAICEELLGRMGSKLEVESTHGAGSTFAFRLELGLPGEDHEISRVDPVLLQGLPVLLAEDTAATAEAITRELNAWRVLVTVVEDGEAALHALRTARAAGRPYPLLLLDGEMPGVDGWEVLAAIADDPGLVGATVFMLPAGAPAERYRRSRALGAHATVGKPVRAAELLQAVLAAVGTSMSDPGIDTDPATDPPEVVRVLVADDHAVNRELVAALLAALGVEVTVVEHGEAAVEAVEAAHFDLVLMDIRMPGMDGVEATRRIREAEATTGRERVPIVAVTAHAMPGDRERLLARGFDGYLAKPLRREALFEVLERYRVQPFEVLPDEVAPLLPADLPEAGEVDLAIDHQRLDQLTGGDRQLALDLARLMLAELPGHRERLEATVRGEDAAGVSRAAHALRGAAGNVGAVDAQDCAATIELAGRDQDLGRVRELMPQLLAELARLEAALQRMLA